LRCRRCGANSFSKSSKKHLLGANLHQDQVIETGCDELVDSGKVALSGGSTADFPSNSFDQ
jgi:hypothetical protein